MICVNKKCSELIEGLAVTVCVVALFFLCPNIGDVAALQTKNQKPVPSPRSIAGVLLDSVGILRTTFVLRTMRTRFC